MDLLQIFMSIMVLFVSLGLGMAVEKADIFRVCQTRLAFLIGIVSQFFFMPFMGYIISVIFDLDHFNAFGLLMCCTAPGGTTSNLFAYWLNGNLALSLIMTIVSSICAIFMISFNLWLYIENTAYFNTGSELKVDYLSIGMSLLLVLVPVSIGILFRRTRLANHEIRNMLVWEWGVWLFGTCFGVLFLLLALVYGVVTEHDSLFRDWKCTISSALIIPLGGLFGFFVSYTFGIRFNEAITVAIETGVQNLGLGIAIIALTLEGEERDAALIIPYHASFMYCIEMPIFVGLMYLSGYTVFYKKDETNSR